MAFGDLHSMRDIQCVTADGRWEVKLEDKVTDFQVGFSRCKLNKEICEPNLDSSTVLISTEIYILS